MQIGGGGDTITHIAVCSADSGDADARNCSSVLFAVVDTADVLLGDGESVTITYNFDISSTST
ncbi:MAG: hypothetical protein HRU07_00740 [Nitrosopumilus sp.]|nr:hypothetical protein [Nitrosopumilus sp.]NRA04704.1 hypothetical protein [Nitrosopumilus sp.]